VIVKSVAFVVPTAMQTLLALVDAAPVTFENVEQQALAVLQSDF
jgi:hypothetical protein